MPRYLVKCYSEWHKGYKNILVTAYSKEEAKRIVAETEYECGGWVKNTIHLRFTPVGAKEVIVNDKGRIQWVKKDKAHRVVVDEKKPQPFTVEFISKKDGKVKTTVVKATSAKEAKEKVSGAVKAYASKGAGKGLGSPKYKEPRKPRPLEVEGIPIAFVTHEELLDMAKRRNVISSGFYETAGSLNSGMTRY